jgi:hypothetical protein
VPAHVFESAVGAESAKTQQVGLALVWCDWRRLSCDCLGKKNVAIWVQRFDILHLREHLVQWEGCTQIQLYLLVLLLKSHW